MIVRTVVILALGFAAPSADAYNILGTVTDVEGAPIPEADVWLSQDRYVQTTTSDALGRFQFTNVDVGPLELVARREGFAIGGAEGQIIDDTQVTLVLGAPDAIRIRIIGPDARPVEGARLKTMLVASTFHVPVADIAEHGFPSIRSDADGVLTIDELPAGSHASFSIVHRRFAESEVPTLPVGSELDVRMLEGERLRGRITNADGEAIERVRVSVFRGDKEFTEVLTDAEGFYSALVPPGEYYVAARHPQYALPDPVIAQPAEDGAIADLVMPPPHIIHGSVVNTKEEPVPGTRIAYIARNLFFDEGLSDVKGEFSVTVSAGEGILRVLPPPRMYTINSPDIPFKLTDTPVIEIDRITLAELPKIEGTVQTPRGVSPGDVIVATSGLQRAKRALTDSQGRFSIQLDAMPMDEKVTLRAEHAFRFLRQDFDVNLRRLRAQNVRLREFQPDLSPPPRKPPNRLHHMVGDPAPEITCDAWFNLPEDMGEGIALDALRGKVVVLTLWGGWDFIGAGPDRTDELNKLYELFKNEDDVFFVSVHDASSTAEEVQQFVHYYAIPFPVGLDADPSLTFDSYNVNTIPQTVLIDKRGILRYFHVDGRLLELIKDLRRKA